MHRLIIAACFLLLPVSVLAQDLPANLPVVVTMGEATLHRAPDRAFITAAVETRAANPRDAQRQNSETMTAVLAKLTAAKITKDAIRTSGYNVQQEFDYVNGKQVRRGFLARNSIEVRVEDVSRLGELLDAVVQSGATNVEGVRFDLSDRDAAEREALRLAVADARARADAAASGAGRTIDRIIRIDETREAPPIPMARMAMSAMAEQAGVPVEPGEIEVRARVTLTASLK